MANEFNVHRLNEMGMAKAERIAQIFTTALEAAIAEGVKERELALVVTKLQEACFFAKRSIAIQPANQVPGTER